MTGTDGRLAREALAELLAMMQREERPVTELMPVARLLGQENRMALAYWRERLRELPIPPDRPLESRLTARSDGFLALGLSRTSIADLSPLTGMPLADFRLNACPEIKTIIALRELLLRNLELEVTAVADLTPVRGMKLESLVLKGTRVTDLTPLAGQPLEKIHFDSVEVTDLSPLLQCPTLRWVVPPKSAREVIQLKALPNLQRISYNWREDSEPAESADEFWRKIESARPPAR